MDESNGSVVSIVMATYNRAQQLESTVKNILGQSYSNIELVIVNDGSTDDTYATLINLQNSFDFIIVNNAENLGLQKSLNIGVKSASGKYIARIDDHDKWIDIHKIAKQVSLLESNPSIGIVGTGYAVGDKAMRNPLTDSDIRTQILMRSPFCHVSVLMSKSVFELAGGYDEALPYSEDWDLWLKMGKHCQLANLPEISVAIQEENQSLSADYFLKQLPINRRIVKQYFKDYPGSTKAFLYHQGLRLFFSIAPLNGFFHNIMKRTFLKSFDLTQKEKASNESSF